MLIVLYIGGSGVFQDFDFDRQKIAYGQWWRLFSGSWVHFTVWHVLMNVAVLMVISAVLGEGVSAGWWLGVMVLASWGIGAGLWWREPGCAVYAGFSGVVQAVLVFALISSMRRDFFWTSIILAGVVLRIAYEHTPFYNPDYLRSWIHVAVEPAAHAFGALAGGVMGLIYELQVRRRLLTLP
ncbi:MAG: rhombosortase [Pseudomonadales bacterium]|nr:rhombosortase [Pseudomonadales bacterium]